MRGLQNVLFWLRHLCRGGEANRSGSGNDMSVRSHGPLPRRRHEGLVSGVQAGATEGEAAETRRPRGGFGWVRVGRWLGVHVLRRRRRGHGGLLKSKGGLGRPGPAGRRLTGYEIEDVFI